MSIEKNTPKEILRDDVRETAIRSLQTAENAAVDSNCPGAIVDTDVIRIILEYVKELEESHAYVFNAYQDLGKEKFKLEEKIGNKIKELEHEKSKRTQLGVFILKNYENQRLLAQLEVLEEIRGE